MLRRLGRWVLTYEPPKLEDSLPKKAERALSLFTTFPLLSDGGLTRNHFLNSLLAFGPIFFLFALSGAFFYWAPFSNAAKFAMVSIGGFPLLAGTVALLFCLPHAYRVAPTAFKEILAGLMTILSMIAIVSFLVLWFFLQLHGPIQL